LPLLPLLLLLRINRSLISPPTSSGVDIFLILSNHNIFQHATSGSTCVGEERNTFRIAVATSGDFVCRRATTTIPIHSVNTIIFNSVSLLQPFIIFFFFQSTWSILRVYILFLFLDLM
jgi:hypothetical protein